MSYKYLIESKEGEVVEWEGGPNRYYSADDTPTPEGHPIPTSKAAVFNDGDFRVCCCEAKVKDFSLAQVINPLYFQLVSSWRGAGVALPIFSIRSKDGLGVGEFLDLKLVVDWAVKTGQSILCR